MISSFPNLYVSSKNNVYNLTTTRVLVSQVICGFSARQVARNEKSKSKKQGFFFVYVLRDVWVRKKGNGRNKKT